MIERSRVVVAILFPTLAVGNVHAANPVKFGPYHVGVKTEIFVDESRTDPLTDKPRTLVTEIYYPAIGDAEKRKPATFASYFVTKEGIVAAAAAMASFGGNFFKINKRFSTVGRRNVPLRDGQFPLLIFSHGNGGFRHQNTFQCDYLASHGYIVAAPDHTGNALLTPMPDGTVVPYDAETRQPERRDDRPKDCSFLVTHLWKLGKTKDHWLRGAFRPGKVGALGHSYGGFTVCRLAELDDRIQAILPMTLAVTQIGNMDGEGGPSPCKIPSMVMLGDADRTVGKRGNDASTAWYKAAVAPSYLLIFKNAGHFTFTEMNQINPEFGDGVGTETDEEGNVTFTFSDAETDKKIVNRYSVAFFDCYVKGDTPAEALLNQNKYPDRLVYERHDGKKKTD